MDQVQRDRMHDILQMPVKDGFQGYLGVPMEFGQNKTGLFEGIIKSVEGRLDSWRNIFLSQVGRLTLIKSVLTSLSNHVLLVFKIPGSIANRVNRAIAKFWWRGCNQGKGAHWRSWKFITRPKERGGIGIRDVKTLNQALLAKKAWRILKNRENVGVEKHKMGGKASSSAVQGLRDRAGDPIASLLKEDHSWDSDQIDAIFYVPSRAAIQCIEAQPNQGSDEVVWTLARNGNYTVRTGYEALSKWELDSPNNKDSCVGGREALMRIHLDVNPDYAYCQRVDGSSRLETMEHIFRDCPKAERINYFRRNPTNGFDRISYFILILRELWKSRCTGVFSGGSEGPVEVIHRAESSFDSPIKFPEGGE
ncbi:hypothetical protein RDABS01_019975 [Bienertia sinuspersici]